jgi:hypothetical protein
MKKLIAAIAVVSILAVGAIAYAHGNGAWGGGHMGGQGYGGHMGGQGYGGHMMGQAYGGHMMGGYGSGYGTDQKFLDETTDLRKELHNKRFEYSLPVTQKPPLILSPDWRKRFMSFRLSFTRMRPGRHMEGMADSAATEKEQYHPLQ